jgi:ribosomal protein S18 acetylase RimI-like enzyme
MAELIVGLTGAECVDEVRALWLDLASRGIRDVRVAVMIGNSGAQRLYERRGLQPAETMLYRFGATTGG